MGRRDAQEVQKAGQTLKCPVCEHDRFWSRRTLMNTRAFTLFDFDWANRTAVNYVCDNCGYIFWFFED